jgi:hypothetical protein
MVSFPAIHDTKFETLQKSNVGTNLAPLNRAGRTGEYMYHLPEH